MPKKVYTLNDVAEVKIYTADDVDQSEKERLGAGPTNLVRKLATGAAGTVTPPEQNQSWLQTLIRSGKDMVAPGMDSLKRLFGPVAGQFGLTAPLEKAGAVVEDAVKESVSNLPLQARAIPAVAAADMMAGSFRPSSIQQQIGAEGIGPAAGPLFSKLGRGAANVGEFFSGVKARDYARLAKDPAAILPEALDGSKSISRAGKELGAEIQKVGLKKGINPGDPKYAKSVSEAWDKIEQKVGSDALEFNTESAVRDGIADMTPQELYKVNKDVSKLMKFAPDAKDKEVMRLRAILSDATRERLGQLAGDYAKASSEYARSAVGDTFTNLLPLTKYGKPSIGRAGFTGMLASGARAALPWVPVVNSPIVHGAATVAAGTTAKATAIPGAKGGLTQILKNYKERQKKK